MNLTVGDRKEMGGMRQDDRGITLVEIIIAIAACVIVISAASLFIRNALQNYGVAADAVDLQIEAQVLMEQLATWVMEGNYVLYEDSDNDNENDMFILYHIPREASGSVLEDLMGERWMRVFWCDGSGKMYMYKSEDGNFPDPTSTSTTVRSNLEYGEIMNGENYVHLLSNYVKNFTVDINKDINGLPSKVTVTLLMKAGVPSYEYKYEINIRNASYEPEEETP